MTEEIVIADWGELLNLIEDFKIDFKQYVEDIEDIRAELAEINQNLRRLNKIIEVFLEMFKDAFELVGYQLEVENEGGTDR